MSRQVELGWPQRSAMGQKYLCIVRTEPSVFEMSR